MRCERKWISLDGIESGTPTQEERDGIPDAIIQREDERLRAEATRKARKEWIAEARRDLGKIADPQKRKQALRIVDDPRAESSLDALAAAGGKVNQSHFVLAVKWAAECCEPWKEPFTPEDARAAVKVLEYFGRHFNGSPAGSGYEAIPEAAGVLIPLLHPIAKRKGTKTALHQYDLITRLDRLFRKICGPRKPAGGQGNLDSAGNHLWRDLDVGEAGTHEGPGAGGVPDIDNFSPELS